VTWSIDATVTPGWRVQVQRPALTPGSEPVWAEAIDNTSHFSIVQPDAAGTSADVGALSTDLELTWRLRIERLGRASPDRRRSNSGTPLRSMRRQ